MLLPRLLALVALFAGANSQGLGELDRVMYQDMSAEHQDLAKMLVEAGQSHLFKEWAPVGEHDDDKVAFFKQVSTLHSAYPGGLGKYTSNARQLLKDAQSGANPLDGYSPKMPTGELLAFGSEQYSKMEALGAEQLRGACFILVAGGLGERLGYNEGVKLELPAETVTGRSFLKLYADSILAFQKIANSKGEPAVLLPLVIMVSDDTDAPTRALLQGNGFFGMEESQVTILKQEKVPCMVDNEATIAPDKKSAYKGGCGGAVVRWCGGAAVFQ